MGTKRRSRPRSGFCFIPLVDKPRYLSCILSPADLISDIFLCRSARVPRGSRRSGVKESRDGFGVEGQKRDVASERDGLPRCETCSPYFFFSFLSGSIAPVVAGNATGRTFSKLRKRDANVKRKEIDDGAIDLERNSVGIKMTTAVSLDSRDFGNIEEHLERR